MNLPPSVRKDVALRLLESLEREDQELLDQRWTAEIAARLDSILDGEVVTIPHEEVRTHLADRRAARQAARRQA